jgi:hypothetical protein
MMIRIILPLALLTGCATMTETAQGPDPKLTAALEGKVAGKPQSCIQLDEARGSEIFRDNILYRAGRNKYWLADAPGCGSSGNNDYILVQNVFGSQLCRGDIIRLVDRTSGFQGGACSITSFTPYSKPKS